LERSYQDAATLLDLAIEAQDEHTLKEVTVQISEINNHVKKAELSKLLSAPEDSCNAILTINAGAGGTESQDWAQMLLRMYQRWSQAHGYKVDLIDALVGEEAGIKSAVLSISGENAYGMLKSEAGVHRLVRISPFDSNKRRHTSFSSIFVTPEIEDDFEVNINPADLRVDVYRSGGKGGQSVNTTDSAVRLTHIPTGIVVTCQRERSQTKNKELAMKVLKSRIYEKHLEEERAKLEKVENAKKDIAWGSQIRSYVLHPYKMVKDHRTGYSNSDAEKVLDGDLSSYMHEYLTCRVTGQWARSTEADDLS